MPGLCARLREQLGRGDPGRVECDVGGIGDPDAVAIEALARLQLTARRMGSEIRLRNAGCELRDMLALAGLTEVVPCGAELGLEPGGKAEQGEPAGRVEEEGDPGDAPV